MKAIVIRKCGPWTSTASTERVVVKDEVSASRP